MIAIFVFLQVASMVRKMYPNHGIRDSAHCQFFTTVLKNMITMYKSFGFNCLAFAQKRASISKTNPNLWCLFFTEWGMEFCPKSIQIFLVLLEFTKEVICVSHTAKRLLSSRVKFKCFCKWKAHFQTSVCFDCWNVYKTMSQSQH